MTYSDYCRGDTSVDNDYSSTTQDGGITIYKHLTRAFCFVPTSRCLDILQLIKVKKYTGHSSDLKISIRENWTDYDIPKNESLQTYTISNGEINTSYGTLTIDTVLILPEANVPYWIVLYSSDIGCCNTTDSDGCIISDCIIDVNKRFEATYTSSTIPDTFISQKTLPYACKDGVSRNCQWTSPGLDSIAFATYIKTYTEPPPSPSCTFTVE